MRIKRIHKDAVIPTYATKGSACFDFYALEDGVVSYTQPTVIRTGLEVEIPDGHALYIFSRSGHGFKNDIRLSNCVGVIDSDYRGEVMIKLAKDQAGINTFKKGERIAQGCIMPVIKVVFEEVDSLSDTERGRGGFGSTN